MLFFKPDLRDILAALLLDFIIGDPQNFYHPVRAIGHFIGLFEQAFHKMTHTEAFSRVLGLILWISTISLTLAVVIGVLKTAQSIHPLVYRAVNIALIFMGLASKSLKRESMSVYHALRKNDLIMARERLSFIVGRDTQTLSTESVIQATVETVAENTSDGVIAPLFYALIGGAPFMWVYKAVNTLDSMVGYTSEKYKDFGFVSAKMDDLLNYLPARLTALLMIASSYLLGYSGKESYLTWKRDCRNHKSPNSGHPEAAAAGALGIQLGGDSFYSGQIMHKPFIGRRTRAPEFEDIKKTSLLMQTSSLLFLGISALVLMAYAKGGV